MINRSFKQGRVAEYQRIVAQITLIVVCEQKKKKCGRRSESNHQIQTKTPLDTKLKDKKKDWANSLFCCNL